jgi:uncharacterized protein (DUF1800 family)
MPLPQLAGTLGRKRATHLLHRATFGATKAQIDSFANLTANQALTQLFQAQPVPALPLDLKTSVEWVNDAPTPANSEDGDLQEFFKGWWIGQMLKTNTSIREKIVFFLHSHFTVRQEVVGSSRALYFQNVLFRRFALDGVADPDINFKTLTQKISIDNAMLVLLDGRLNVNGAPNENYARELLELYSIGRGLEGTFPPTSELGDYFYFTEQDVQAAARVLSGWDIDDTFTTLDPDTDIPQGVVKSNGTLATQHDNKPKEFSARFGNAVIQGDPALMQGGLPTQASVLDELDQLIELIYAQPETARNICRKIYRFFVYYDITPDIEANIIPNLVATFQSNGYKIQPVIRDLLGSQHFYDANAGVNDDNFGAIIKSPLDLITGTLKFLEFTMPNDQTDLENFYATTANIVRLMADQGMNFLNPYDVAGYEAYHQFPVYNRFWITTNSLTQRYNLISQIFGLPMPTDEMGTIRIDLYQFVKSRFDAVALDVDALIRALASYLLPLSTESTEITTERYNYFKARFLDIFDLTYWQTEWVAATGNEMSRNGVRTRLEALFNAMLQTPEYQLF